MSVTSRSPLRLAGANIHSGNINTGELPWTKGGMQVVSSSGMFSGNPDGGITLVSGVAGRANQILLHLGTTFALSGIATQLYDAHLSVSGGPLPASGHKFLAVFNSPFGVSGQAGLPPGAYDVDMPFQSGLHARGASGGTGYSVSWTPEVTLANPG